LRTVAGSLMVARTRILPSHLGPARFFAGAGAFAFVVPCEGGDACDIWLGARAEHPLKFLQEYDAALWDRADF
jgi:hypothetical protein